jgi:hypothetical protein
MIATMRRSLPALATVVAVACASQLDVGIGPHGSDTSGDDDASVGSSTAPMRDTEEDTSATTSGADDGTSISSASSSSDTGDTDDIGDSPCASGQKVCAEVELDGEPAGFCGQTLELKGIVQRLGPTRWSIEDCAACELCAGPIYEVEFFAPPEWAPAELPLCSRIAIDFAELDTSPFACAFTGVAIWGDDGSGIDPAPVYVAASITTDPQAAVMGLQVNAVNVDPKPCDESACCVVEPGKYDLTFSGAGIDPPVTLAEHEEALGIGAFGLAYDVRNETSHADAMCDRIPHFDWILRR